MPTSVPTDEGRFFDGNAGLGGIGQCGPYSSDDFSEYVRYGLNFDLEDANRGVVRDILSMFQVQAVPAARQILVQPGAGFCQGKLGFTISNKTLDINNNLLGAPRFDRLVLRRDNSVAVNQFSLEILHGTTVAYPALTQNPAPDGIWEIPLWRWVTPFPFVDLTGIAWDHNNDERHYANLASGYYARLTNSSGADQLPGAVVIHAAAAQTFTTTTQENDHRVAGVLAEPIANGMNGKVCLGGLAQVVLDAAATIGDYIVASSTAGQGHPQGYALPGSFARAVETTAGAGRCWCMVFPTMQPPGPCCITFPWTGSLSNAMTGNAVWAQLTDDCIITLDCDAFGPGWNWTAYYVISNGGTAQTIGIRLYNVTDAAALANSTYTVAAPINTNYHVTQANIGVPQYGTRQIRVEGYRGGNQVASVHSVILWGYKA